MLEELKKRVCEANILLKEHKLAIFTWGNASGIDREKGLFCIKPSGVEYEKLTPDDMVVLDLDGNIIEGRLSPSSDTPTHLELYKAFPSAGGIVHTHSRWATVWAQAGRDIPAYGTTHADYFYGAVPCTRPMSKPEIDFDYEKNTGAVIIERFAGINPEHIPAVLVNAHGPFTWGKSAYDAFYNAAVLEEVAMMAWHTENLPQKAGNAPMPSALLDRHFLRKHGENAYYGQKYS